MQPFTCERRQGVAPTEDTLTPASENDQSLFCWTDVLQSEFSALGGKNGRCRQFEQQDTSQARCRNGGDTFS